MGSIIGKSVTDNMSNVMEENMAKQMAEMERMQDKMLARQMSMNNFMRENQMAMQVATARESLTWYGTFYMMALMMGVVGFRKGYKMAIVPSIPLTWVVLYNYHLGYGAKLELIRRDAKHILNHESTKLQLPRELPTVAELDSMKK